MKRRGGTFELSENEEIKQRGKRTPSPGPRAAGSGGRRSHHGNWT